MNEISFEEAFRRLETIVSTLESGRGELEESLARYEEGIRLLRRCRQILDGAERRVEILKGVDENGAPILEQADENALRSQTDVAGRQTPPATAAKSGVRTTAQTENPARPANSAASGGGNVVDATAQESAARPTRTATARRTTASAPVPPSENSTRPEPTANPTRTRTSTRRTSASTQNSEPPKRSEPPRGRSFFDDAPPF